MPPREKLDPPKKAREPIFPPTPKADAYIQRFVAKGITSVVNVEFTSDNPSIYGVRKATITVGAFKDDVLVTSWIWRDTMREHVVGNSKLEKHYGVKKP